MSRTRDSDAAAASGRPGYLYEGFGDVPIGQVTTKDPFYSSLVSHDWQLWVSRVLRRLSFGIRGRVESPVFAWCTDALTRT